VDGSTPFGALLRTLREAAGLSQEELAARAGLSSHAVSALERGTRRRPYPHTVRSLADALDLSSDERARLVAALPARGRSATPGRAGTEPPDGTRLPVPGTPLHGRDGLVEQVVTMLGERRLVTLTGTGGVGKTRLALAVAERAAARFVDGVVLVELAALHDVGAVLPAVADALDVPLLRGGPPEAAIAARLSGRQLLLVLDNFEHLTDASVPVLRLVEAAPDLVVLVTSRAPLQVRGETEVPVDPLPDEPSRQLLLERARAVSPGWGGRPQDAADISLLCRRLAGIPLALELAAARARVLGPAALLERLDDAVAAGPRDLPRRQRTMRATLDWSYHLLAPEEQRLLRLLAVFVGGFRLDDLEGVAGLCGTDDVLLPLEGLAAHSLVVRDTEPAGGTRYRVLEPVGQYARTLLEEAGELERASAAHARHFLGVAEQLEPRYRDGGQVEALARIDAEHANLTAAVEHSLDAGEGAVAARFAWALWMYWWLRGHHVLGRRLAEAALAHDLPGDVLARAELAAATMCFAMDDLPASRAWWESATAHALAGEDPLAQANSIAGIGLAELGAGHPAEARDRFLAALPLAETAGAEGDWIGALARIWLGTVALVLGDADAAEVHVERGLASARRRADRLTVYVGLYNLSQVATTRRDHGAARRHLEEGMRLSLQTGDHANLAYFLDALAVVEAADQAHARVPLLLGAAQGIREAVGARGYHYYRPDPDAIAAAEAEARARLGADRFDDALDVGRDLAPREAAALGLGTRTARA
jgi:predicted ATPase/DNA-binding XRE family transcriptional regulator